MELKRLSKPLLTKYDYLDLNFFSPWKTKTTMTIYEIIILLSLALTPLTIYASFIVVILFWHPFTRSLKKHDRTAVGWMITGVVVNFIGSAVDNIWWGLAWSAEYVDHSSALRDYLFENGVYSNVVFRQSAGVIGALCHIQAGRMVSEASVKKVCFVGAVLGVMWVITLVLAQRMVIG